ncbi:tryptophan--tRNA ligase [Arcanobacterium haemolyticum]|uniref:Tryptophan--tRNA ligase n=1 Tax=Arcanobacterium haemolyticum (strain ATCC 9345 / DSM 20595 / CCM 5947 / CCUG 17215 / LMG 16163 / NBRC 15585 / NCTC 8452 / 11018) TaxID=644284 RepID=D7BMJ5_ARCHD|nr:tryptophan--tRNA ligase [Arcanobacterium haemolyticum]ADH92144.1 tryptophanyl-tRNA synthetase [Arcanobacterium haemolyticum DSM 20595]SQH29151.1 Tryptophan--tRNA ligase 2 [Arcanobacterium haemolyticum]
MSENTPELAVENATSDASLEATRQMSDKINLAIDEDPSKFRVLTGARPTGHLHIGHYFGTLQNWVKLQKRGVDTWLLIADYQVITDRDEADSIQERTMSLLTDYLAVGMDPEETVFFAHSQIPELNELVLPFLSVVTDAELRRNPTVKAEFEATHGRPMSGLLLTYPVHQAADILFCKANLVPVGKDQLPHLEQARVIADRFEKRYNKGKKAKRIFPRPHALLSDATHVLGLDGEKMSKSRGNTIELRMSADETAKKLKRAVTDSDRHITYDPTNRPEVSNLLLIASMCIGETPETIAERIGDGGGGTLKNVVTEALNEHLAPMRARRAELEKDQAYLREVLQRGIERAREQAQETLDDVHAALGMRY